MNSYRISSHPSHNRWSDPVGYARRRVSSIPVVAGLLGGLALAGLLESAGVSITLAIVAGAGVALAVGLVAVLAATSTGASRGPDLGWAEPIQLGPDHDQVIGRATGART